MAITVTSRDSAWEVAHILFPTDYAKDEQSSKNAGYPIYKSTADENRSWICDLGNRLELNIWNEGECLKSRNIWIEEPEQPKPVETPKDQMLAYLKSQMDDFKREERRYGIGNRIVMGKLDAMIACKEMVEALIGEPVNLRQDGTVTVGF